MRIHIRMIRRYTQWIIIKTNEWWWNNKHDKEHKHNNDKHKTQHIRRTTIITKTYEYQQEENTLNIRTIIITQQSMNVRKTYVVRIVITQLIIQLIITTILRITNNSATNTHAIRRTILIIRKHKNTNNTNIWRIIRTHINNTIQ